MKSLPTRSTLVLFLLLWAYSTQATARSWTGVDGTQFEAEYVRVVGEKAILNCEGEVLRVTLNTLSPADRRWIDLKREALRFRLWRTIDGREHRGRFISVLGKQLVMDFRGSGQRLPWEDLIREDQQFVRESMTADGLDPPDFTFRHQESVLAELRSTSSRDSGNHERLRTWTDVSGRRIEARYLRLEDSQVVLQYRGRQWPVPLARLSPEDQAVARRFNSEGASGTANGSMQESPAVEASPEDATPNRVAGAEQERGDTTGAGYDQAMSRWEEERRQREERWVRIRPSHQKVVPHAPPVTAPPSSFPAGGTSDVPSSLERHERPRWETTPREPPATRFSTGSGRPTVPPRQHVSSDIETITCLSCNRDFTAEGFQAGSRCPHCRRRIDVIQNPDGTVQHASPRYYAGYMKLAVVALIAIAGLLKKMLG